MPDRTEEEKIRAEFEKEFPIPKELFWDKENETYNTNYDFQMMNEFIHTFIGFEYGYKAGAHSKQEKIEELETLVVDFRNKTDDLYSVGQEMQKELSEKDKQIEEMKTNGKCNNYGSIPMFNEDTGKEETLHLCTSCGELDKLKPSS